MIGAHFYLKLFTRINLRPVIWTEIYNRIGHDYLYVVILCMSLAFFIVSTVLGLIYSKTIRRIVNGVIFLKSYEKIAKMNIGSFTLYKKDFEKDADIDYVKLLASRHSVREFQTKRLSEKDLRKAIRAAILSPSACNRQMIKVYSVSYKKVSDEILKIAQGFGGFEKETINLLVVTFDVEANYFNGERNQGWFNAGLFSMNLVNALHLRGIGSCFCQFGNTVKEEEQIKEMLNIPSSERIAVLISAGYYCDKCQIPFSPRKNIEDIWQKRQINSIILLLNGVLYERKTSAGCC